jgi:hypothetical protein
VTIDGPSPPDTSAPAGVLGKERGMRRAITMLVGSAMLCLGLASPTLATTARESFSCDTVIVDGSEDGGHQWQTGTILHVRGWSATYTMTGSMTFRYDEALESGTGGIAGTAVTRFDFVSAVWKGSTVGHGYGSLAGWQTRGSIVEQFDGTVVETGFAFRPGS